MVPTFAEKAIDFYGSLTIPKLPTGIEAIFPYGKVAPVIEEFHQKFFADSNPRIAILGINPGRFGAGVTAIPFTDPIHLQESCAILNDFQKRHELSSQFVYQMINSFGGAEEFYRSFFITAVCPIGFLRNEVNCNYYDDKNLEEGLKEYIVRHIDIQMNLPLRTDIAFVWGQGKNYKYFNRLNDEFQWFNKLIPQPHPRWIMQYRRKKLNTFVREFCQQFQSVL